MSLTLHGMGSGPIAALAGSTSLNALGYILGSTGLDLKRYKLDKEVDALNYPTAYLTAKKCHRCSDKSSYYFKCN